MSLSICHVPPSDGYGTFRTKTSSSLGRFDRDDSRKKSNGTVRAKNWDDSLKIKFSGRFTHFCIIIYIYDKRFALQKSKIPISL